MIFVGEEFEDDYKTSLNSFSRQWLETQLTHRVSAKATNSFWSNAMDFLPKLLEFKLREGRERPIPQFVHQRKQLYKQYSPDVKMEFAFKNKIDGSIIKHSGTTAPLKEFQLNPNYSKLYEIASVKVMIQPHIFVIFP